MFPPGLLSGTLSSAHAFEVLVRRRGSVRINDLDLPGEVSAAMRVLMFGWEFPPYQAGGLATATSGLVQGLLAGGVEVTLVLPFSAPSVAVRGLRLRSTNPWAASLEGNGRGSGTAGNGGGNGADPYNGRLFEEIERYTAAAAMIARQEPFDVIDCHDWITYRAALQAQKTSGAPLVAHAHSTERDRAGDWVNPEILRREAEGLAAATRVIANSHSLRRRVIEEYGLDPARIEVVHWGIERRPPPASDGETPFGSQTPIVLFVGRVTFQKGPHYFLDVANRVAHYVPEARFLVVGSGDMLPGLIERSVALGLIDRMHFTGQLDGDEVDRVFRIASVCVMPSVSEPFGLVALESVRNGTPCILPRGSGVAEVLGNALRADFWDIDAMADQVVAILRHRELREELRERALSELGEPRLGLEQPGRLTANVYRRAINSKERGADA